MEFFESSWYCTQKNDIIGDSSPIAREKMGSFEKKQSVTARKNRMFVCFYITIKTLYYVSCDYTTLKEEPNEKNLISKNLKLYIIVF
jgi:hypothetical protein